jgi:hypothetical protein
MRRGMLPLGRKLQRPPDIWPDPDPHRLHMRKQPQDREWLPWLVMLVAITVILAGSFVFLATRAHAQLMRPDIPGCIDRWCPDHCRSGQSCARVPKPKPRERKTIVIIVKP